MGKNQDISSQNNIDQITFDDFDKLKLKAFAENIFQIMEKGTSSSIGNMGQKGSYPISLNALFGNGKTTFLKMFEHFIKTENQQSYEVLFINAWESDFYNEPVIAILSELASKLDQKNKPSHRYSHEEHHSRTRGNSENQFPVPSISKIKEVAGILASHKITQVAGNIANQIIQSQTGFNLKEVKDSYQSGSSKDMPTESQKQWSVLGENVLNEFNQRKQAIKTVKEIIVEHTNQKKLLIIVDELDRTRPDYAVHFLEDMKHFFDIENVVFLVAVNRQQMEATVKCLYGQSLNFDGYYSKFFKTEIDLPDPYKSAQNLVYDLIKKTNIKYQRDNRDHRVNNSYLSYKMFGLTLRELEQFIRIYEMILGDDQKSAKWVYQDAYSLFIGLFIKEKEVFQKILDGKFTVANFVDFINKRAIDYKLNPKADSSDENNIVYDNQVLLGQMACSFIKWSRFSPDVNAEQNQKDINLITQTFQIMNQNRIHSMFEPMNGFSEYGSQPAIEICKTINQHKSAFKP